MYNDPKQYIQNAIDDIYCPDASELHERIIEVTVKDPEALTPEQWLIALDVRRHADALRQSILKWHSLNKTEET